MVLTIIVIVTLIFLAVWLRTSKGRIGEHRVAHILGRLSKDRYQVINNLLLRTSSGGTTQIDHVVISEYGIFVIETKFYEGWIYGGENSEYWTQNIYGHKYSLRNPIHQNQGHIRALKHLLKDFGNIPFISIVAFSRQCRLGINASTPVIYWNQIPRLINQFGDKHLTPTQVIGIHNRLIESNRDSKESRKEHIRNVRTNEQRRNTAIASGKCPRCGGDLILRHGPYGPFYGCSNYPRCRYILK